MSNLYGANPEQLEQLGTTLKRQIESINSVMSTVTGRARGARPGWARPATGSSPTGTGRSKAP